MTVANDPAVTDRHWVGYHPRAMAPLVAIVAVVSVVVWTGHWYLDDVSQLADVLGGWAMFGLAWGVWPALVMLFLYRTVTFTYRLTNSAIYTDFGPLFLPTEPILLSQVDSIVVCGGWLARRLKVGTLKLRSGNRVLLLTGVSHPESFASQIRAAKTAQSSPNVASA